MMMTHSAGVKHMVPSVAKCEAETAQKLGNFGDVILPLGCDSFGPINALIAYRALDRFWPKIAVLSG